MKKVVCFIALGLISLPVFAARPSIRYVALGDSYTIGTGATPDQSWPALVAQRLQNKNIPLELVANLGRNGWTTQNLIDYELPVLRTMRPDVVTLLIGTNDWVQGVDEKIFQKNFHEILGRILSIVPDPNKILVITIPDFSVMPAGKQYSGGRDIARGIAQFNQGIMSESKSLGVRVLDICPLSQTMGQDLSLSASDGLHPSAKGYAQWADLIGPVLQEKL